MKARSAELASANVTNPKPRDRWVTLSKMTDAADDQCVHIQVITTVTC